MRTPNHGTMITKISQKALAIPLISWFRKTSMMTLKTSMIQANQRKKIIIDQKRPRIG